MKTRNLLVTFGALAFYLVGDLNAKASDIPLEQLLGTYVPRSSSWGDTKTYTLTIKIEANQLVCIDSVAKTFKATYKDQILFIDFDQGLFRLDEKSLPESDLYCPIRWGERIYLIHKKDVPGFCDAINAGIEPHAHWDRYHYYLKGNWDKKVTGDPELPAEYKSHLLRESITGKVIELAGKGMGWVDLSSDSGVRPGMTLMNHWMPDQLPKVKNMPGMIEPRTNLVTVSKVEKARCLIEGELLEIGSSITSRRWN